MGEMLQIVLILKALNEVAWFALAGMGLMYAFAGEKRHANPIYQVFRIVAGPAIVVTRFLAPRFVLDRHIPALAFFLVSILEAVLILWKVALIVPAT